MRKIVFFILTLLICMLPTASFANYENVKVTVPSFPISMNGIQVDNMHREYPFLMYKGITYFPLTYHDCRFLGIENKFNDAKIMEISKTGITAAYRESTKKIKNKKVYEALVSNESIKVNGEIINNREEEYPFLTFKNIIYLPMTYKFWSDEFDWKYEFDDKKGLTIKSFNQMLKKIDLVGYTDGSVILVDDYFYYGGEKGTLLKASINYLKHPKKIYQLPKHYYGDCYVRHYLFKKDADVYLKYREGSNLMGRDSYIKINSDGFTELMESGRLSFKRFGNMTIKIGQGVSMDPGNLMLKADGKDDRRIGNPDYLYGYSCRGNEQSGFCSFNNNIYMINNEVYILGIDFSKDTDYSRIYKVNIFTNEISKISDLKVGTFKIYGNNIYAASEGKLYQIPLKGGIEKLIKTEKSLDPRFEIQVLNGEVYYVADKSVELYKVGSKESLNPGALVTGMKLEDDYLVVSFIEAQEPNTSYRIMVFDKKGNIVFKTSDVATNGIENIFIDNSKLGYIESSTNNLYLTSLLQ